MKKTVTINISGIIFHIEEDAYQQLQSYLHKIGLHFNTSNEREEIISDIESRIAELLKEKITKSQQVVTSKEVERIISIMGKPEEFADENSSASANENKPSDAQKNYKRRLFRDTDNKLLGGVCSGIAAYFDWDVVWIRVIFVVLTLLGISGVLLYLILWIVVPEAQTALEKLQMRGDPTDISNISKTVKAKAEKIKKKSGLFREKCQ